MITGYQCQSMSMSFPANWFRTNSSYNQGRNYSVYKKLNPFKFKLAITYCSIVFELMIRKNTWEISNNVIPMCTRPCVFADH